MAHPNAAPEFVFDGVLCFGRIGVKASDDECDGQQNEVPAASSSLLHDV